MGPVVKCPNCGGRNDTSVFTQCRLCSASLAEAEPAEDAPEYHWARGCGLTILLILVPVIILAIWQLSTVRLDFPDPEEVERRRAAETAQFEREQRLVMNIAVDVEGCFPEGARGKMTNHNDVAFKTRVRADFYDGEGKLLRGAATFIELAPGESREWALPRLSLEDALEEIRGYARCEVRKRPDGSVSMGTWQTVHEETARD